MFCRNCQPNKFPRRYPVREGHVSVIHEISKERAVKTRAFLDGVEVTQRCVEAIPGEENGLVVLFDLNDNGNAIRCDCGSSVSFRVEIGNVKVMSNG